MLRIVRRAGLLDPASSHRFESYAEALWKVVGADGLEPSKTMGRQIYSLVQLPLCDTPEEVLENAFRGTWVKAVLTTENPAVLGPSGRG